jgi:integrase
VATLSAIFLEEYVRSRQLDSVALYENAFKVHILPVVGKQLAELLTRDDARKVMNTARVKRDNPDGRRGAKIGGVEASRTTMRVMRHMYSWAIEERKLKRTDNPCSNIIRHLPKMKKGEVVFSVREARVVWQAAKDCGYPFGSHAQLMLLTGCRMDEWASAEESWIDLDEALMVVPAASYKSDRVHVVPLVPQAMEILRNMPKPTEGPYILSSREGRIPIKGVAKFFRTTLSSQILANTGSRLPKKLASHALRRTVATRLAELLGDEGDKLVKRVLGHSDGSVTAIYNRYGYIREMRRALEMWANELTVEADCRSSPLPTPSSAGDVRSVVDGAVVANVTLPEG